MKKPMPFKAFEKSPKDKETKGMREGSKAEMAMDRRQNKPAFARRAPKGK